MHYILYAFELLRTTHNGRNVILITSDLSVQYTTFCSFLSVGYLNPGFFYQLKETKQHFNYKHDYHDYSKYCIKFYVFNLKLSPEGRKILRKVDFQLRSLNSLVFHYCVCTNPCEEWGQINEPSGRTALADTIRNINNNVSNIMKLCFVLKISSKQQEKLISSVQTEVGNLKLWNYSVRVCFRSHKIITTT